MATVQEKPRGNGFREELKYWIPIIVLIVSMAVSWGVQQQKIDMLCDEVTTLKQTVRETSLDRLALETRLSRIESDLAWIRLQFEKGQTNAVQ